jgi:hypothetical protein
MWVYYSHGSARGERQVKLRLHECVAFAGRVFERRPIKSRDAPAAVLDEPGSLQRRTRQAHRRAPHASICARNSYVRETSSASTRPLVISSQRPIRCSSLWLRCTRRPAPPSPRWYIALIGVLAPGQGHHSVADARVGLEASAPKLNDCFRALRFPDPSPAITGGGGPSAAGLSVADPRTKIDRTRGGRCSITSRCSMTSGVVI